MLGNADLFAVYHGVVLRVLKEHAHNGGLRHEGTNAAADCLIGGALQHLGGKAGAVVAVNRLNTIEVSPAVNAGIYGQVTALRVATYPQANGAKASVWEGTQVLKLMLKSSFQPTRVLSVPR